jgi:hypothetical protein
VDELDVVGWSDRLVTADKLVFVPIGTAVLLATITVMAVVVPVGTRAAGAFPVQATPAAVSVVSAIVVAPIAAVVAILGTILVAAGVAVPVVVPVTIPVAAVAVLAPATVAAVIATVMAAIEIVTLIVAITAIAGVVTGAAIAATVDVVRHLVPFLSRYACQVVVVDSGTSCWKNREVGWVVWVVEVWFQNVFFVEKSVHFAEPPALPGQHFHPKAKNISSFVDVAPWSATLPS